MLQQSETGSFGKTQAAEEGEFLLPGESVEELLSLIHI